jgi:hypothetical protein
MQVSTCSAAKIYIDIEIPEDANYKDRYHPKNVHIENI